MFGLLFVPSVFLSIEIVGFKDSCLTAHNDDYDDDNDEDDDDHSSVKVVCSFGLSIICSFVPSFIHSSNPSFVCSHPSDVACTKYQQGTADLKMSMGNKQKIKVSLILFIVLFPS